MKEAVIELHATHMEFIKFQ